MVPESLNHFQQINCRRPSPASRRPASSPARRWTTLKDVAAQTLPPGYTIDYAGASRQFVQESSGFAVTFGFALIIIFLALAAQFESFRDPLIILVSVPMSIAGALVFIMLGFGGASINIYTQVGLVTLMGLISKHGILIVEFANELQHAGKIEARGDPRGDLDPPAADPDDDGGDGARRGAADHRDRRRRRLALQYGPRHRLRPRRSARCSRCSCCRRSISCSPPITRSATRPPPRMPRRRNRRRCTPRPRERRALERRLDPYASGRMFEGSRGVVVVSAASVTIIGRKVRFGALDGKLDRII